jgi:cyanobactin maturation PatA/PatG family protease
MDTVTRFLAELSECELTGTGHPDVCVSVLDGPVDLNHPCFRGASLRRVDTLVQDPAGAGTMSMHGTHVASVLLGRPGTGTLGLAAGCRGLTVPVFHDRRGHLSQLDLARAIERAVLEGANVINISGGERAPDGHADPLLERALRLCETSNVLVVGAAGNDGAACVHVPAAVPPAIAVGALGRDGLPVTSSNFGSQYRENGVLAPGERIPGATPGGGIAPLTGSSFAAPLVSGLCALLMCAQLREHGAVDARAIRDAVLDSAVPGAAADPDDSDRYLRGLVDVRGAYARTIRAERTVVPDLAHTSHSAGGTGQPAAAAGVTPSAAPQQTEAAIPPQVAVPAPAGALEGTGGAPNRPALPAPPAPLASDATPVPAPAGGAAVTSAITPAAEALPVAASAAPAATMPVAHDAAGTAVGVEASGCGCGAGAGAPCSCGLSPSADAAPVVAAPVPVPTAPVGPVAVPAAVSNIFAIGTIGTDFGTEARRDTFRQLMPNVSSQPATTPPTMVAPNPYDAQQLVHYLDANTWDSTKLIWTLNHDLTPIYALEAEADYPDAVYEQLREALLGQVLAADDDAYVSRVSIPGVLTTKTVRLFSGQVVPVVKVQRRGLWLWNEKQLVDAVLAAVDVAAIGADADRVRLKVQQLLDKVYWQLRNLGQSPMDRAINYMATNAFQLTAEIAKGLLSGQLVDGDTSSLYSLDTISAAKSPYCRPDSDCWDVNVSYFNPTNDQQARLVFQSTIDVSDVLPVLLAPAHQFLFAP